MTEAGYHQLESSPTPSQSSTPSASTKSDPIDTSSQPCQHEETQAPPADHRHDSEARAERISAPEDDTSGKCIPSPLRMAMFTAVAVWVILGCYQGILYITGAQPVTAALATALICTTITSQPSFLGRFIYPTFYAVGFVAAAIETAVHEGYAHDSESHSRGSSRRRSSGGSSPETRPVVPKKSSRIRNMKIAPSLERSSGPLFVGEASNERLSAEDVRSRVLRACFMMNIREWMHERRQGSDNLSERRSGGIVA